MGMFDFLKKKQKEENCGCGGGTCCESENSSAAQANEKGEEMAPCDCGNMCPVSEIEAKKAAEVSGGTCCGDIDAQSVENAKKNMENGAPIKILGSGCKKCNELEQATKQALLNLSMPTEVDHVTDFAAIASYGVMSTPALVVNGKVVSYGKVLKVSEVEAILKKEQ